MSTQGRVRRNWISAEVYTETRYYDYDPSETIRSMGARIGPFEVEFNRWPGDGYTHRRDWRLFRGSRYLMGRTPWGNWDVRTDGDHDRVEEYGDVPQMKEAR